MWGCAGLIAKALGLLCLPQALCLSGGTANGLPSRNACAPVVRSTAWFAFFCWMSLRASLHACGFASLCWMPWFVLMPLEYLLFAWGLASSGLWKIMANRAPSLRNIFIWKIADRFRSMSLLRAVSGYPCEVIVVVWKGME